MTFSYSPWALAGTIAIALIVVLVFVLVQRRQRQVEAVAQEVNNTMRDWHNGRRRDPSSDTKLDTSKAATLQSAAKLKTAEADVKSRLDKIGKRVDLNRANMAKLIYVSLLDMSNMADEQGGRFKIMHNRILRRLEKRALAIPEDVIDRKMSVEEQRRVFHIMCAGHLPPMASKGNKRTMREALTLFLFSLAKRRNDRTIAKLL